MSDLATATYNPSVGGEWRSRDASLEPINSVCVSVTERAGTMVERKPHRIVRDLTPGERSLLQVARADAEAEKDGMLEQARAAKAAWLETRRVVDVVIANLKAERERQALSLADVEVRTGIRRSVLSRLENDATSNPTMLTLQRYAVALGMSLREELTNTQ